MTSYDPGVVVRTGKPAQTPSAKPNRPSEFTATEWTQGSPSLARFDGTAAIAIDGSAAAGASSGDAMDAIETMVSELPGGYTAAWSGLSYQERLAGSQAMLLYAVSLLVVFLCLAALYESWSIPFSVILTVPVGVFGPDSAST